MPIVFDICSIYDVNECSRFVRKFAIDFGLDTYESSLLGTAVSEATTNAVRYADGCMVEVDYTKNNKGISILVEDTGLGIEDLENAMKDGVTSSPSSLGLGLGAMKRSVDEFNINKSDKSGTSINLVKYHDKTTFDIAEVSIKKEGESFNGDECLIKNYQGENTFFAVLDGAGSGFKAYESASLVKNFFQQNVHLDLDTLIYQAHELLLQSGLSRAVEVALLKILPEKIEYIILGNTFIKFFPHSSLFSHDGSIGLRLPKKMIVNQLKLDDSFCAVMATDGIEDSFDCYENHSQESAASIATMIFNNYNLDDDSSLIVIKNGAKL